MTTCEHKREGRGGLQFSMSMWPKSALGTTIFYLLDEDSEGDLHSCFSILRSFRVSTSWRTLTYSKFG